MDVTLPSDGEPALLGTLRDHADSILRGVGQVMFQDHPYTGLLFLVGIFYASVPLGLAALLGTIVGTYTGLALGADRASIRAGLFGFNGTLVGVALVLFLGAGPFVWGAVILAAASSSVLMAGLTSFWSPRKGAALTAPFVLASWTFLLAARQIGRLMPQALPAAALPGTADGGSGLEIMTLLDGTLRGVGQVFFQDDLLTGGVFIVALLVSSRRAAIAAVFGALVGLLTGWILGASESELRAGLFGFNSVLTAIALGATFLRFDRASALFTAFAAIVTTFVFAALVTVLQPLGMVPLTAPFVVVVWAAFLAEPLLPRLEAAS